MDIKTKNNALLPILLLSLAHLTTDISQGALPVMLPFLQEKFALTYSQIGFIVLIQNLTSSVIQPVFGYLTDKTPYDWLIPFGVAAAGVGIAVTGLAVSYSMLLGIVILTGIGVASFHPQASKSANFLSSVQDRGRSMGLFSVGGNGGMAVGSLLMAMLIAFPGGLANSTYLLIPNIFMLGLLFYHKKSLSIKDKVLRKVKKETAAVGGSIKIYLLILLGFVFVRSTMQMCISTYLPLYYLKFLQGDLYYAPHIVTLFLITGTLSTYVGATMSDRFGRKKVLLTSMLLSLPFLALIPFSHGIYTIILAGIIGFTVSLSSATTVVLAQELMPNNVGMAAGLTIGFSIGLGGMGVTLLGNIADSFGLPLVFQMMAAMPILAFLIVKMLPDFSEQI